MINLAISLSLFASFRGNYRGLMLFWSVMWNNISGIRFQSNLPRSNKHNNDAGVFLSRGTKVHIEHMVCVGRMVGALFN